MPGVYFDGECKSRLIVDQPEYPRMQVTRPGLHLPDYEIMFDGVDNVKKMIGVLQQLVDATETQNKGLIK